MAGGTSVAPSYLLFGCRGEKADFYYSQLWQQLLAEGILAPTAGLLTAFSRDQKQKVYVQDKLRQHSKLMWDLLQQVASMVCVCLVKSPSAVQIVASWRTTKPESCRQAWLLSSR